MDDNERAEVRSIMTERIFQPGQQVMTAGDTACAFSIIERGTVEVWLTDSDGKKVILDVLGPGKFFGELAMLAGETRSASATSAEEVATLELDRNEFFDFLRRRPDAALDVLIELGQRLKHTDDILRTRVSRNPNDAEEGHSSGGQRVADLIADFSGSIPFLLINLIAFVLWIITNTLGPKSVQFDPYPFQFLTMAVSLEAIFLSIFVLISQNRQSAKDRIKADLDYQVNVKTELEMSVLTTKMQEMEQKLHHIHLDVLDVKKEQVEQEKI
jgi:uncharacterized membrane protein